MISGCKYGFYTCSFIGQVDFCNTCEDGCNYTWNEYFSEMDNTFNYIKAAKFFPDYCPDIKDWKKKMTGRNGRGNPLTFTDQEMKQIKTGLKKMMKDIAA